MIFPALNFNLGRRLPIPPTDATRRDNMGQPGNGMIVDIVMDWIMPPTSSTRMLHKAMEISLVSPVNPTDYQVISKFLPPNMISVLKIIHN